MAYYTPYSSDKARRLLTFLGETKILLSDRAVMRTLAYESTSEGMRLTGVQLPLLNTALPKFPGEIMEHHYLSHWRPGIKFLGNISMRVRLRILLVTSASSARHIHVRHENHNKQLK